MNFGVWGGATGDDLVCIVTINGFKVIYHTPHSTNLKVGILVTMSVCASVDRIVSALYFLQYWPDLFHNYTSYQTTSKVVYSVKFLSKLKNLKFWQILETCNFDFVLFWLGIQYELVNSMGNHGAVGVSSKRWCSSCSSCHWWHRRLS